MVIASFALVGIQFSILFYFAVSGDLIADQWYLILAEVLGVFLGIWAITVMNQATMSIFPQPKMNGNLIVAGPYQFIRHPMYTAILLVCLAIALSNPTTIKWIMYAVLLVNQLIKLHLEESMLLKQYPEYEAYQKTTKKLIPYLF